jgi:hypothetical protein
MPHGYHVTGLGWEKGGQGTRHPTSTAFFHRQNRSFQQFQIAISVMGQPAVMATSSHLQLHTIGNLQTVYWVNEINFTMLTMSA